MRAHQDCPYRAVQAIASPYGIATVEADPGPQLRSPSRIAELGTVALRHILGDLLLLPGVGQQHDRNAVAARGLAQETALITGEGCAVVLGSAALPTGDRFKNGRTARGCVLEVHQNAGLQGVVRETTTP